MGNLINSFWTGVSGLKVHQSALNTTGHNLSNVDTTGFVRQQVVISDWSYNTVGYTAYNTQQIGLGTNMAAIRQVRDVFLDKAYRLEVGRQGFYEAQYNSVMEMEDLFGEMEGVQFQNSVQTLRNAIQELAKEPDSISKRALLIESAQAFMERADSIQEQVKSYQIKQNKEIVSQVKRINQIGDQIKELNGLIQRYEADGQNANDYRDTRNNLLDELGSMVKISYNEDRNGVVTVNVEGVRFVDEQVVFKLDTEPINAGNPMLKVVWTGNGCGDLFNLDAKYSMDNNTDVGSLKGLIVARGDFEAKYTDIPLEENYATKADYDKAVEKYNNTVNSSPIMIMQAQFDQMIHELVTGINDILSPNASVNDYLAHLGSNETTASVSIEMNGVTLTQDEMDKLLVWDEGIAPIGAKEDTPGREGLFNRKSVERYTEAEITINGVTKKIYVYNQEDPTKKETLFTLGEIEVNPILRANYSALPLNGNSHMGGDADGYDFNVCEQLVDFWGIELRNLDPNTVTKNTIQDYYIAMMGANANRGKVFSDISTSQADMVEEINTDRSNVTGVSSDEELTNLVKFQHAYNASSRYINVIDEMLEHIIIRLG